MNVVVKDIMSKNSISISAHRSIGHARTLIQNNHISILPVIDKDDFVVGVLSPKDFINELDNESTVNKVMSEKVFSIPQYEKVQIAARMMRNHKIHHLMVTHEKKLIGVISSYDLLKLVEGHRFEIKNQGTVSSKGKGKRAKSELQED